ncbi:MAG: hypothetical protein MH219_02935 [Marinobacter sp.]|nr:hypothetical protein [Marinobacter sp.]
MDHGHAVGEVNDGYLDFGTGVTSVFGWQMTLGGPFGLFFVWCFCIPMLSFLSGLLRSVTARERCTARFEVFQEMFDYGFWDCCLGESLWFLHACSASVVWPMAPEA